MAGILFFQFLLFCLNTGIALWIKFPYIDLCHTYSPAISGDLIFLRKYIYQCIRVIQIVSPYQTELG